MLRGFFLVALVVELVDTQDLKSCDPQRSYRFKSDPGHNSREVRSSGPFFVFRRVATIFFQEGEKKTEWIPGQV